MCLIDKNENYFGKIRRKICENHKIIGELLKMIEVTKLNGQKILINPDLMETVEETPDTVISFTTGKKIIVKESRQEVKNLVKSYRKDIFAN